MSLWIKICANTSLLDAQLAVEAGADAVGFVFAPSPRRVNTEQVAEITPHLPSTIEKIGVFVDADFSTIASAIEQCGLTGVQLQTEGSHSLSAQLRQCFGDKLRILRVIHFGADATADFNAVCADANTDAVLVDSRTATAVGGTGIAFDWGAAQRTIFSSDKGLKLIAAGGLNPANVAQAVAILRPWGVDVASGVESAPGRKDTEKVRAFVMNARTLARGFV